MVVAVVVAYLASFGDHRLSSGAVWIRRYRLVARELASRDSMSGTHICPPDGC